MDIMALVLCLVITLAAFVLMAPLLSFTRIFGHSSRRMRRHHLGRQLTRYVVTRQGVNDGTKRAIEDTQDQDPEPTCPLPQEIASGRLRPSCRGIRPRPSGVGRDERRRPEPDHHGHRDTVRFEDPAPQWILPAPPGDGNDTRDTGPPAIGVVHWKTARIPGGAHERWRALPTASPVSAPESSGTIIRGQTLEDSAGGPRPLLRCQRTTAMFESPMKGSATSSTTLEPAPCCIGMAAAGDTDVDAS